MGLNLSFKVAPGVRYHVGKNYSGVSCNLGHGVRVGYSTSSYKKNAELKKRQKEREKLRAIEQNELEVEIFENKLDMIREIHKECDAPVDWQKFYNTEPPFYYDKGEIGEKEKKAREKLDNYKPSFFARLFRGEEEERTNLEKDIKKAREDDLKEYNEWKDIHELSRRVLNKDIYVYPEVIQEMNPFDDLLEFGSGFEFFFYAPDWIEIDFEVNSDTVVPNEVLSLTKTGRLSTKKMTKTMYYDIQQDYICSCCVRMAEDMFALLPIDYVVINAIDNRLDTSTGFISRETILSVKIEKDILDKLNLDAIDPSDSMVNFTHNMKFKKTGGLCEVPNLIKRGTQKSD